MSLSGHLRRRVAAVCAVGLGVGLVPFVAAPTAQAATGELFISEYIEGSSNNKALEIYNGTGSSIDLATGGYNVQMFFNGNPVSTLTINLTGSVSNGDVFVLAQSSAAAAILAQADQTNGAGWFNGDDAIVLRKGTTAVDSIGQVGFDPGTEWGSGLTSTADNTLRRKSSVTAGDTNLADTFDPAVEWDGFATDTFDGLGSHTVIAADSAPTVTSTTPATGATAVDRAADITVTFSEPVNVAGDWFTLSCSASGAHTATVTGGPTTYVLDPVSDLAINDNCTLTIKASAVSDADADDPPDTMVADVTVAFTTALSVACTQAYTPIPEIQGSGDTVALTGTRTTQGVVVGDYEGASPNLRGFYLQDTQGDGNAATSDGIFVFEGSNANTVSVGDLVRVTGTAGENQGQSQVSVGSIVKCGTGSVAPTAVSFPVSSPTFLERYEGMLVSVPEEMTVTEHFQLGRFGQVVVSSEGRLQQPTNVVTPGNEALVLQAANNNRKLIIDDASQAQNPDPIVWGRNGEPLSASNTLRGGDTVTGATGVMTYTWAGNSASGNAYRLRPLGALGGSAEFTAVNDRPVAAPEVGGRIRVASMNLLNYFNTFDGLPDTVDNCTNGLGGTPTDCRGADTQEEFDRQAAKTVQAISGLGADVIGVNEVENDGYGADSALANLVGRLNAVAGSDTWAYIDADARTGQTNALGTDAIKVGMIYQPAAVTPVGTTAALNTERFVNGGDNTPRSRPVLAQAFRDNTSGGVFVATANHFKSKGSACNLPDQNDGQGNCNAVRTVAAEELAGWLASDPTGVGDPDILVMGDLNSYAKEDPVRTLETAGYTNLVAEHIGPAAYSYVFDGQWGYLDHALASDSLRGQVTGVGEWHINADEPSVLDYNTDFKSAAQIELLYAPDRYRVSDHDPVIVGLNLTNAAPVLGTVTGPTGPVRVNTSASVSAPFTDADRLDVHTATIDWGDGTSSDGTVTGGTVSGSHTYQAAGIYTVTVTVRDEWGNEGSATFHYVVVYDPAAGFVTGGGWISAPASGGYPAGKGEFQLSAKYLSGASAPTGSLTYTLGSALTVAVASLDWLVVDGSTAVLAGPATVNGVPGYDVEVTVVDNGKKKDTFGIVVRDAGGVVYDTGAKAVTGQVAVHP